MTTVFASPARTLGALLVVTCVASGCGLDKQSPPSLGGPSGHALSLTLTASPDILPRDGEAVSNIRLLVRDAEGQPRPEQRLRLFASAGTLSASDVVTGGGGEVSVTFIAPAFSVDASEAVISAVPVGDDFANSMTRNVTIALLGQAAPVASFEIVPDPPQPGEDVVFDARGSTVGAGVTIDRYYWSFGDGDDDVDSGAFPAVRKVGGYSGGTYIVTLTITDSLGRQDTAFQTVTVAAEEEEE